MSLQARFSKSSCLILHILHFAAMMMVDHGCNKVWADAGPCTALHCAALRCNAQHSSCSASRCNMVAYHVLQGIGMHILHSCCTSLHTALYLLDIPCCRPGNQRPKTVHLAAGEACHSEGHCMQSIADKSRTHLCLQPGRSDPWPFTRTLLGC